MWGSDGIQSISYVGVDPGNHNVIFSTSLASTGPEFAKFPPRVSGFSLSTIFNSPPREGSNLFFFFFKNIYIVSIDSCLVIFILEMNVIHAEAGNNIHIIKTRQEE